MEFDLTSGTSSDHSDQTFSADVDYTIYIYFDSSSANSALSTTEMWHDAGNLDSGDTIVFVDESDNTVQISSGRLRGTGSVQMHGSTTTATVATSYTHFLAIKLSGSGGLSGMAMSDSSTIWSVSSIDLWSGVAPVTSMGYSTVSGNSITLSPVIYG